MPECGLSGLIELHPIIARLGTIRRIIDFTKGVCWLFCNRIAGCTAHPRSATGQRRRSSPRPQCPQLPPIAGIRLIPNDRRLVPKGDLSRCNRFAAYSITSSARSMSDNGTSTPIALAVLRLITNSNFVGCSTGRSAGFAPRSSMTSCRAIISR
jgi:hypothetical protein